MKLVRTVLYALAAGYWLGCFTAFLLGRFLPSRFDIGFLLFFAFVNFLLWSWDSRKELKLNE